MCWTFCCIINWFFSYVIFFKIQELIKIFVLFQDVDDYYSVRYPKLYQPGLVNLLFNKKLFLLSAGEGFLTSIVLFFIPYGAFYMGVNPWGTDLVDLQSFGVVIASILVVAVNLRVSMVHCSPLIKLMIRPNKKNMCSSGYSLKKKIG